MLKKILYLLPIIVACVLFPAIYGPLLIDDGIHIAPIQNWLHTRADTIHLIFGNTSGPFGRPVSMFSFMLNAVTTGPLIWPMKLTNLLLHIFTGICLSKLFYHLFKRDLNLSGNAKNAGALAACIWLILPQHISTVFYVIQRMTILASLFSVLACLFYVLGREQMDENRKRSFLLLSSAVGFTFLSVLSKESGLLIPLYFLLIELICFRPTIEKPRPRFIAWGFRLGVFLPCILIAAYLTFTPSFVLHAYVDRPFSLTERAMTQISVLGDYFASTFIPMVRSAGIYNDDFPIAHGLALKEYLLLTAGIGLTIAAIRFYKVIPSFSLGFTLFLVGHLLESSIFSLEIYFAHRNYFPSMGLVLATSGLLAFLLKKYPESADSLKCIFPAAFIGIFLAYTFASYSRAILWSDKAALLAHAQIHHPGSARMHSEVLTNALYAKRLDLALRQADMALKTAAVNERRTAQLWRILAFCYAQTPQTQGELDSLSRMSADRITMATSNALNYVGAAAEANSCPGLDRNRLGLITSQWATNTVQPPYSEWVWRTHLVSARLLASSGNLEAGLKEAKWAFYDSGFNFEAGVLAFQLANSLEDAKTVEEIVSKLINMKANYTNRQQIQLKALRN